MMKLFRVLVVIVAIFSLQACWLGSAAIKESANNDFSHSQEKVMVTLLRAAEEAVLANRLTTPIDDNAYDRYRAVLVLDRDNAQAKRGLAFITERYLEWAQASIHRGDLTHAAKMVAKAQSVKPESVEANNLADQIRKHVSPVLEHAPQAAHNNEWPLDIVQLNGHHPQLISELGLLAKRLKLSGEAVLIVSRNDKEGRWIYKQMRQAVPGYRLRGNIQMGQQPKVVILPAI